MAALQANSRRGAVDTREHVPYRESRLTRLLQVFVCVRLHACE